MHNHIFKPYSSTSYEAFPVEFKKVLYFYIKWERTEIEGVNVRIPSYKRVYWKHLKMIQNNFTETFPKFRLIAKQFH